MATYYSCNGCNYTSDFPFKRCPKCNSLIRNYESMQISANLHAGCGVVIFFAIFGYLAVSSILRYVLPTYGYPYNPTSIFEDPVFFICCGIGVLIAILINIFNFQKK